MTDEEFAKTLKFNIGDIVTIQASEALCEVEIIDIDITAHRPSRLQNPYKIRYEWGETVWTDFK
jgi:hypothetical protein